MGAVWKGYRGSEAPSLKAFSAATDAVLLAGVREDEAVQGRAAGLLFDLRPLTPPQHRSSGHQGLLSCSRGSGRCSLVRTSLRGHSCSLSVTTQKVQREAMKMKYSAPTGINEGLCRLIIQELR